MSDPIWFRKGQDKEYSQWRNNHIENGNIINKDGAKWRLHTPKCPSIYDNPSSKGHSLTSYTKICSTSISRLEIEARRHGGEILTGCNCQLV